MRLVLLETGLLLERPTRSPADVLMETALSAGLEVDRQALESALPRMAGYFVLEPGSGTAELSAGGLRAFFLQLYGGMLERMGAGPNARMVAEEAYLRWAASGRWGPHPAWLPLLEELSGAGHGTAGLSAWQAGTGDAFLELALADHLDFILVSARPQPQARAFKLARERVPEGTDLVLVLAPQSPWRGAAAEAGLPVLETVEPPPLGAIEAA